METSQIMLSFANISGKKIGSSEESVGERAGFLGRILGRLKIA